MQNIFRHLTPFLLLLILATLRMGWTQPKTYCNPLNIDYAYGAIPNFTEQGKHRTTADPAITLFKGNYLLNFQASVCGGVVSAAGLDTCSNVRTVMRAEKRLKSAVLWVSW